MVKKVMPSESLYADDCPGCGKELWYKTDVNNNVYRRCSQPLGSKRQGKKNLVAVRCNYNENFGAEASARLRAEWEEDLALQDAKKPTESLATEEKEDEKLQGQKPRENPADKPTDAGGKNGIVSAISSYIRG